MSASGSASAPLPAEPKHKGTLACVVLKAKNLPNKRSIGKQDPFAVLSIGTEKQKTKPDKRGGQHPTWDEQLHFEIYEDVEDVLARRKEGSAGGGADTPDSASPAGTIKAGSGSGSGSKATATSSIASATPLRKAAGGGGKKILKVACYADDNKEPEFIGEGLVDLTGVLKTGEFDEWVTIRHKDRYCGEVYLELTFFSAGPRPRRVKKTKPAADSTAGTYGGAGTFSSEVDDDFGPPNVPNKQYPSIPSSMRPVNGGAAYGHRPGMSSSASTSVLPSGPPSRYGNMGGAPPLEEVPPSLRPSSSLAGIATYTPPYAPATTPQPSLPHSESHHRSGSFPSSMSKPEMHSMYVGPPQSTTSSFPESTTQQQVNQPYPGGLSHSHSQSFSAMPSSFSTSSIASVGTIRPSSTQPPPLQQQQQPSPYGAPNDPIQDLIRPMSSMSVQTGPTTSSMPPSSSRPMLPPTPSPMPTPSPYQHNQSASAPPPTGHPGPPPPQSYDHYAQPPSLPPHRASYSRVPSHSYNYPGAAPPSSFNPTAPTPPPPSHSAPPETQPHYGAASYGGGYDGANEHHHPQQYGGGGGNVGQPEHDYAQSHSHSQQIHPAQTFVPSHGSAPSPAPSQQQQMPTQQPPPPPHRPVSSSGYHALPPVPGSQTQPYRAPSPAPLPQPPHQQPYHQQQQGQMAPSASVINAQSLYDPYQQQQQQAQPPQNYQHSYPDPYQGGGAGGGHSGRAPSPAPPMSSFSQPPSQPDYYGNPTPTPPPPQSRPLPPTTPQSAHSGLPPAAGGYYNQQPHGAGLPVSPGGAPYQQQGGYGHPPSSPLPPPPPHSPYAAPPQPVYQAPPPDQPRYIQSPYDAYHQQQQQPQQQPQQQQPYHQQQHQPPSSPLPSMPSSTSYYQ